jgi:hypothetical protein
VRAWLTRERAAVLELPVGGINAKHAKGKVNVDFITGDQPGQVPGFSRSST